MTHTHHYSFWHAHQHEHVDSDKGIDGWEPETSSYYMIEHNTGHHHFYSNIHEHGPKSNTAPHSHKEKQYHPKNDIDGPYHHHAIADHEESNL
ncbi:hypothetical protein LCGC14_1756920 [marine sediment metagenome]|uniref:Uncharacterized protein n=1 Tax=marine sediment metagenome TaxID=412755 RepID=A0A0F9K1T6_9ZZZZ